MKRHENNLQNDYHLTTEDDPNDYLDDYLKVQRRNMKKQNWEYPIFAVLYYLAFLPYFYPIYRVLTRDGVSTPGYYVFYGSKGAVNDLFWVFLCGGVICSFFQIICLLCYGWRHKSMFFASLAIVAIWILAVIAIDPICKNNRMNKDIPDVVTEYLTYQYGTQDAANMDVLITKKNLHFYNKRTFYYDVISPTHGTFHLSYYYETDPSDPSGTRLNETITDDTNPNAYTIEHVTETSSDTVED